MRNINAGDNDAPENDAPENDAHKSPLYKVLDLGGTSAEAGGLVPYQHFLGFTQKI